MPSGGLQCCPPQPSLKSTLAWADLFPCVIYCQGLWQGESAVDRWSCFFRISFDWKLLAVPSAAGSVTEQRAQCVPQVTAALSAQRRFWLWKCPDTLKDYRRDRILLLLHSPVGRRCDIVSGKNKGSRPRDANWNVSFFIDSQCHLDLSLLICKMAMKRLTPENV